MATGATVISSVRFKTGYTATNGPVTDVAILSAVNEVYPVVRRMVAKAAPDLFATESADLVVAAGATEIDVSAVSGLDTIFEVKRLYGSRYRPLDEAGPDPEASPVLCWRRRGMSGSGAAIEIYPAASAPGTYRLRYLATAADLVAGGTVLLPAGGEGILAESAAAELRDRRGEDYSRHIRARDRLFADLKASLTPTGYVTRYQGQS